MSFLILFPSTLRVEEILKFAAFSCPLRKVVTMSAISVDVKTLIWVGQLMKRYLLLNYGTETEGTRYSFQIKEEGGGLV